MRMKKARKCFYPSQLNSSNCGSATTSNNCDSGSSSNHHHNHHHRRRPLNVVIIMVDIYCPFLQAGRMKNPLDSLHYVNLIMTVLEESVTTLAVVRNRNSETLRASNLPGVTKRESGESVFKPR